MTTDQGGGMLGGRGVENERAADSGIRETNERKREIQRKREAVRDTAE